MEDQNVNAAKRINGGPAATSSMPTVVTKANLINQQRRSASPALVKLEAAVNDDNDYDIDDDDNDNNADNLADREPIPMVDLSEDSPRICYSQPRI